MGKSTPKGKPVQGLTKYGCWNIRRGLIKHETEIKQLLNEEKMTIMFLVETDTKMIRTPEEYKLEGFITILQKKDEQDENLRIIALIEEELSKNVKIREDLMSTEFPSIWIEVRKKNEKGKLIRGFYREWTHKGTNLKKTS